ncbi:MAG: class I SAM-dependent methyltransferase [Bacteroidetes bacterium]|nr:MAG: class I SAM-dependent methyltransferase [Bacteroidota bacterium]
MKDNFSRQASIYSKFRPDYPDELIEFILEHTEGRSQAWDCGTGNGQFAKKLSPHFKRIFGTDISDRQLNNAEKRSNIIYQKERAESSSFQENQFDLITVAQAIHWFDFKAFYAEVRRTLKPGGTFCVSGYSLLRINPTVNEVIDYFYSEIIGPYWDPERKYIDENYRTIPFPFKEIICPEFHFKSRWTIDQLKGYLNTWSSVQHYLADQGKDPVKLITPLLHEAWGIHTTKEVHFPILLRMGKTE